MLVTGYDLISYATHSPLFESGSSSNQVQLCVFSSWVTHSFLPHIASPFTTLTNLWLGLGFVWRDGFKSSL